MTHNSLAKRVCRRCRSVRKVWGCGGVQERMKIINKGGNSPSFTTFAKTVISKPSLLTDGSKDRRDFKPKCGGTYNPSTISYTLTVSWTIDDPLVLEAVTQYSISIIPIHETLQYHRYADIDTHSFEVKLLAHSLTHSFTHTHSLSIMHNRKGKLTMCTPMKFQF